MSKIKIFLLLSGYQLTWLACIFGEKNYSEPLIGFFTGLIFLLIYFTYTQNKKVVSKQHVVLIYRGKHYQN